MSTLSDALAKFFRKNTAEDREFKRLLKEVRASKLPGGKAPTPWAAPSSHLAAQGTFEDMRRWLYSHKSLAGLWVHRERGQMNGGRPYFFLKAAGHLGWLFECSETGWVVSRAEKIVADQLFLRKGQPWDLVNILTDPLDPQRIRLVSQRMEPSGISFLLYLRQLVGRLSQAE